MGFDMSEELFRKLERNRAEGRLCGAATRSRAGCSQRAVVRIITTDDLAGKTYGPMVLCKRHAKADYAQPGYTYQQKDGATVIRVEVF